MAIQEVWSEELNPMKKYLAITDEENLKVILSKNIFGVKERHLKLIHKLKKDDQIIIYLKPKRIVAAFKVKDTKIETYMMWGEYQHQILLSPMLVKDPIPLDSMFINNLSYFKNKLWGPTLLGKALIELPAEDWDQIYKLLN
ncbi:MAG: hypothetical protein ACP5N2_02420 [Candidatus Nanoarchaeia archaeon]